jgi:hypothetical protein
MTHSSAAADVRQLLKTRAGVKLDLGCGTYKQGADWVGVDARPLPGVDVVHDLETFPWPLPDNCAHTAVMSHLFEHVKPWLTLPFMAELHRVCQPEAQVFIAGPYAMEYHYVQDPTHCNPVNETTFVYWDDHHHLWGVYQPPVFHLKHFERVPVQAHIDFAAVLQVCKPGPGEVCRHAA